MKPWQTDRPDLERRDRVRAVKRRLAELLHVEPFRIDEILRQAAANPTIDASSIVLDALTNKRAAGEIRRLLFDLLIEPIAELITVLIDERIADERRSKEASAGSGRESEAEGHEPDALDFLSQELDAQAGEHGDAWEG